MQHIQNRVSNRWELKDISISHNIIDYEKSMNAVYKNSDDLVRLHFGLKGSYEFSYKPMDQHFNLQGHHNNILFSHDFEIDVLNHSHQIETFGIDFQKEAFIKIGQHGNEILKTFTEKVIESKNCLLSNVWLPNNFAMQQVIDEIIHCPFGESLRNLFLLSKTMELLVLQAQLYEAKSETNFITQSNDKKRLFEAKELLNDRLSNPPTIIELAKLIGLNEYKLKRGFKEIFGITIFGYIHQRRMTLAKRLLLGTDKTSKEIAFETGYSSPQHFSNAFKKNFGVSPKVARKNPDSVSSVS